jgi:hypothetical protein
MSSFFREVCRLDLPGDTWLRAIAYENTARSACWWWPHKQFVMVSDRPKVLTLDTRGQLHNETGMAIQFSDGWGLYRLHGVTVPRELVMTPAERLDPRDVLKDTNAEIRRERVRKIGIERVCAALGAKVLDQQGEMYELLSLDLGDNRTRPYLKMRNPSIGVFHIEGVHPDCRTVEAALKWRNGTATPPAILT